MVYLVWLQYALRIFLSLFDRLNSHWMVRVELTFVCCHLFSIHMIFPSPQQPLARNRHKRPNTVQTRIRYEAIGCRSLCHRKRIRASEETAFL
jgi:hypothetical protein